jgi:hypothetical protein
MCEYVVGGDDGRGSALGAQPLGELGVKKPTVVSIPACVAASAIERAGSMPSTASLASLKKRSKVPSLEPMSSAREPGAGA